MRTTEQEFESSFTASFLSHKYSLSAPHIIAFDIKAAVISCYRNYIFYGVIFYLKNGRTIRGIAVKIRMVFVQVISQIKIIGNSQSLHIVFFSKTDLFVFIVEKINQVLIALFITKYDGRIKLQIQVLAVIKSFKLQRVVIGLKAL
jgi:hypothetical protein